MKKYFKILMSIALLLTCMAQRSNAQAPGSVETTGGTAGVSAMGIAAGGVTASAAESLYIGPGDYTINGTWEIYSKNVWISPQATFTGSGTVKFFNPSTAGGAASASLVDGNNSSNFINVNIELDNAANMVLTDITGPGGAWTDSTGKASLRTGADFKFNVTNGDVLLGNYDMITATAATFSGYLPSHFVVTNGTGHLVHNNYTGNFIYPVGIAEGDYTPAAINNTIANTMHVLVQNYTASTADEATGITPYGMDRTWNIYANNATGNSVINLQHNTTTNQSSFDNANHFVTRWSDSSPNTNGDNAFSGSAWENNNAGAGIAGNLSSGGTVAGSLMISRSYTDFATAAATETAYYTKETPMPVPDLSPAINFYPSTIVGTTNIGIVLNVYEFNNIATSGLITVYITKDPQYTLAFNPAATTVSGKPVNNAAWTFDATSNPSFYILTTSAVIPASGLLAAGFTTTYNPHAGKGSTIISAIVASGSGGELDDTDNSDDDQLNYKP